MVTIKYRLLLFLDVTQFILVGRCKTSGEPAASIFKVETYPEDDGGKLLQKFCTYLPNYAILHMKKQNINIR
jgi:hypothetical protein